MTDDVRALRILLMRVNEARNEAADAIDRCPDPDNIISADTYIEAVTEAHLDPVGIREETDPVAMIRGYPSFQQDEVRAYRYADPEWVREAYARYDVLRTFYKGIARLAEERTKEMHTDGRR